MLLSTDAHKKGQPQQAFILFYVGVIEQNYHTYKAHALLMSYYTANIYLLQD